MCRYYKYRSLKDFRYFVDIIVNKRLYAAKYTELNDPIEGHYTYYDHNNVRKFVDKLYNEKQNLGIVSLSKAYDNILMWSHYADSHAGVALGIKLDTSVNNQDIVDIRYNDELIIEDFTNDNMCDTYERAKSILSGKLKCWEYEKEVRVFKENIKSNNFIKISIVEVILGSNISDLDKDIVTKLIKKHISPNTVIKQAKVKDGRLIVE